MTEAPLDYSGTFTINLPEHVSLRDLPEIMGEALNGLGNYGYLPNKHQEVSAQTDILESYVHEVSHWTVALGVVPKLCHIPGRGETSFCTDTFCGMVPADLAGRHEARAAAITALVMSAVCAGDDWVIYCQELLAPGACPRLYRRYVKTSLTRRLARETLRALCEYQILTHHPHQEA